RDIRLVRDATARFAATEGHTLALVVLHGTVQVNAEAIAREGQLVHLDRAGGDVVIEANGDATVLWLSGEPIDEPIVGYGPFVMTTGDRIWQPIDDFNRGRFGRPGSWARRTGPARHGPSPRTDATSSSGAGSGECPIRRWARSAARPWSVN